MCIRDSLYPVLIIQSQNYKMVCLISAADNIYPAKNFLQLQTDKLQEPVTCILSKQIIDKLKILNIDIDNSGTVSYTHLDVYKRQCLHILTL